MFLGDQLQESKLKSPISIVGKIGSRVSVSNECSDVGSSTLL